MRHSSGDVRERATLSDAVSNGFSATLLGSEVGQTAGFRGPARSANGVSPGVLLTWSDDFKAVVGILGLPTRSLFGDGIRHRLLLRVSLAKPTSALFAVMTAGALLDQSWVSITAGRLSATVPSPRSSPALSQQTGARRRDCFVAIHGQIRSLMQSPNKMHR